MALTETTETTEFTEAEEKEQGIDFIFFDFPKKIKPTFFSVPSVRDNPVFAGFTLIEVLVALLVLTVVVSAALESQVHSLKLETRAHVLQLFRFEIERIYSVTQRARDENELGRLLTTNSLCRVRSEPVIREEGTNRIILLKHALYDGNAKAFSTEFYNSPPPGYGAVAGRAAK